MLPAAALAAEATVNSTTPKVNTRLRPRRSAIDPAVRTTDASARVYASTTHCRPERPASRSSAMCPSAVLTTAMSSMRIAVASEATARVPFLLIVVLLCLASIARLSIDLRRCGGVAYTLQPDVYLWEQPWTD